MNALIEHGSHCPKPDIQLRSSWDQRPQAWCANCGRWADLPTVVDALAGVVANLEHRVDDLEREVTR